MLFHFEVTFAEWPEFRQFECTLYVVRFVLNHDDENLIKSNAYEMNKVLSNFYAFCDKDKSSQLDERESTMGLFTIFKIY
jgi:hypothetical protein